MTRFRVNKKGNKKYLTMRKIQNRKTTEIYVGMVSAILDVINKKTTRKHRGKQQ